MKKFSDIINEAVTHSAEVEYWKKQVFNTRTKINAAKRQGKEVTQAMLDAFNNAQAEYAKAKEMEKNGSTANPTASVNSTPSQIKQNNTSSSSIDTNSPEYKQGYDDAIKAFKKMMEEAKNGQNPNVDDSNNGNNGDGGGAPFPSKLVDNASKEARQQRKSKQQSQESSQQSRDDETAPGKNQGVVRPEDCAGDVSQDLGKTPSQAGGMVDKKAGDKLAESEGYEKIGGSESGVDSDWQKTAMDTANKIQQDKKAGNQPGYREWAAKIKSMNRPTTDWKKTLRKVVGRCLSEEDKRQAYAHKNTLISQNRVARTDKDKYDAMSTIVAFIDTSGSMDDSYKLECLMETYHVANQKKATKILIIPFDTRPCDFIEVNDVRKMERQLKTGAFNLRGGGGTDLTECWNLFKDDKRFKGQLFELVMVFTDGYLDQKKRLPRSMQHLVWVIDKNPSWELQYKDANTYRVDLGDKNAHKKT